MTEYKLNYQQEHGGYACAQDAHVLFARASNFRMPASQVLFLNAMLGRMAVGNVNSGTEVQPLFSFAIIVYLRFFPHLWMRDEFATAYPSGESRQLLRVSTWMILPLSMQVGDISLVEILWQERLLEHAQQK